MNRCLLIAVGVSLAATTLHASDQTGAFNRQTEVSSRAQPGDAARPVVDARPSTPSRVSRPEASGGPLAVPIYRGDKIIGWVTPDPSRMTALRSPKPVKAAPTLGSSGKLKAPVPSKVKRPTNVRQVGSVAKIKTTFRKALRERFYKKPMWVRSSPANNQFRQP